jgi:flagellar basal-body rod protein FlgB
MAAPSDGFMLVTTNAGHMSGKSVPSSRLADTYGQLQYRVPRQPSLDGNTVDPDTERVQFADNALHFESAMTEVSSGLKGLMSVITSGS